VPFSVCMLVDNLVAKLGRFDLLRLLSVLARLICIVFCTLIDLTSLQMALGKVIFMRFESLLVALKMTVSCRKKHKAILNCKSTQFSGPV
jgi:hypothetical protein